ncbi:MAG TPA: class I SAM-dependent methyltransferase [Chitinophagaceae bacterium]
MIAFNNFEEQYISIRRRENRLYNDEQVKWLPNIHPSHPHYKEWLIREHSANKLIQYLAGKRKVLNILEVGCGNGWLAAQFSKISGSNVAGIDINQIELAQAKRVFDHIENVEFINCEITDAPICVEKFDVIIFAASVQYFSSLHKIIEQALRLLVPGGEIHIIDSFFYKATELEAARKRSAEYYDLLHSSEMAKHYFHHDIDELKSFKFKIFYNPDQIINRFLKNKKPFHWICIYNG